MANNFLQAAASWQYPCGVVFVGAILGYLLYRFTPPPLDCREHGKRMVVAHMASLAARVRGHTEIREFAKMAGQFEGEHVRRSLRRQRRWQLVIGLGVAAIALLPAYALLPLAVVPEWVFVVLGVLGSLHVLKSW